MSSSMWSAKNWKGAGSPYSSPIHSIGVKPDSRTVNAASRHRSAGGRSPSARLPTWSWFWVKTTNCSGGRSPAGAPKRLRRKEE
jgi:hypothetical protein